MPVGTRAAGGRIRRPISSASGPRRGVSSGTTSRSESGDVIEIGITPDSLPSRLLATFFAQPGEIGVGDLLRLSAVERSLVIDMSPGRYNVRLHAQWFEGGDNVHHKVNYVFGITIPGEPGLESSCISTAAGGILGILLESLDDPDRTALDAVNGGGCTFNSRIASVVLILGERR